MSAAQNPMQKQGGPMQGLPPAIQQALAARQMGKQGGPMQQMPQQMPQQMQQMLGKQGGMFPQGGPMQQGAAGGKGGMPGAQNPMQQNPMQQIGAGGPMNPAMYKQSFMQQQNPMQQMQQNPMQQSVAGGKGGMPGAGPNPNAMQQFSQQQNMAGLMKPQQSSLNSLQ